MDPIPNAMGSPIRIFGILIAALIEGCVASPMQMSDRPPELDMLERLNATVNRQGLPCSRAYCLDHWPAVSELERIPQWDCKAYAVAKADRLIRSYGYSPDRLEYLVVSGPGLRVSHAALLVDGRWVLDQGLRCQVCDLDRFASGGVTLARVPVQDLHWVTEAMEQ